MNYLQVKFTNLTEEIKEVLIALLAEAGFSGFEEDPDSLLGYVEETNFREDHFEEIVKQLNVQYSQSVIENINWNKEWESHFEPVSIMHPATGKPFVFIRAEFHAPSPQHPYEIIVTPRMSFGTGHHATTFMMIEQMASLDLEGKEIIDFGTGTGILSILAEKMGARKILAIDYDEWSITNARENFGENSCERIELLQSNAFPSNRKADIILANINLNVILANLELIASAMTDDSIVVFSGLLNSDAESIINASIQYSLETTKMKEKNGWLLINAKKRLNS